MRSTRAALAGVLAAAGVLMGAQGASKDDKPKTIKDVMLLHKGKDSFLNHILAGKGTDEDHRKLVVYYEVMAALKPPQGDEKSWKEKTEALLSAARDVAARKSGAIERLKKASDCKSCHGPHKPK
ncbi:MAG: hypothetical protein ACK44W_11915 [Planctomycetota bacterium]